MGTVFMVTHVISDGNSDFDPDTIRLFASKESAVAYAEKLVDEIIQNEEDGDFICTPVTYEQGKRTTYTIIDHDIDVTEVQVED
jgi:hypothetical protein